jgi:dihydroneopterin aldolase
MTKPPDSCLYLYELKVPVHLGTSKAERAIYQMIKIDLAMMFHTLPKGCLTDELSETVCYATLIQSIKDFCQQKPFQLIEHLGYQLYQFIKTRVALANIRLRIKKTPKVDGLGYCVFELNDGIAA